MRIGKGGLMKVNAPVGGRLFPVGNRWISARCFNPSRPGQAEAELRRWTGVCRLERRVQIKTAIAIAANVREAGSGTLLKVSFTS